jgi:hypothetical protein
MRMRAMRGPDDRMTTSDVVKAVAVAEAKAKAKATVIVVSVPARRPDNLGMTATGTTGVGDEVAVLPVAVAEAEAATSPTTCVTSVGKTSRPRTIQMQRSGMGSSIFFPRVMDS